MKSISEKPNKLNPADLNATSMDTIRAAEATLNSFTVDRVHRMQPPSQRYDMAVTGNMEYGFHAAYKMVRGAP